MLSILKGLEVGIELERRGGRRGAAPKCWQVDALSAVLKAPRAAARRTGDPAPPLQRGAPFLPPAGENHLKRFPEIFILFLFLINFLLHWVPPSSSPLDLKMALLGLTARKAKADLFDYSSVPPALSDWAFIPHFSCAFFSWKFGCFYNKDGRYLDLSYNMLFYAAFHFVIAQWGFF